MRFVTNFDNQARSGPHRKVEKILDKLRISYISEQPFLPYAVDIYLPEWHLGIEIDGPLHSKSKDEKKDNYLLEQCELIILRLKSDKNFTVGEIEDNIKAFLDEKCDEGSQRKLLWQMKR